MFHKNAKSRATNLPHLKSIYRTSKTVIILWELAKTLWVAGYSLKESVHDIKAV